MAEKPIPVVETQQQNGSAVNGMNGTNGMNGMNGMK
jgi:hypothetical protein